MPIAAAQLPRQLLNLEYSGRSSEASQIAYGDRSSPRRRRTPCRNQTLCSLEWNFDDIKDSVSLQFSRHFWKDFETMDVLSGLTDDQMALVICCGALFGCGAIMSLSYYIGSDRREDQEIRILRDVRDQAEETKRKAA